MLGIFAGQTGADLAFGFWRRSSSRHSCSSSSAKQGWLHLVSAGISLSAGLLKGESTTSASSDNRQKEGCSHRRSQLRGTSYVRRIYMDQHSSCGLFSYTARYLKHVHAALGAWRRGLLRWELQPQHFPKRASCSRSLRARSSEVVSYISNLLTHRVAGTIRHRASLRSCTGQTAGNCSWDVCSPVSQDRQALQLLCTLAEGRPW